MTEDYRSTLLAVGWSLAALGTIAVVGRVYSRTVLTKRRGLEDAVMVFAWVSLFEFDPRPTFCITFPNNRTLFDTICFYRLVQSSQQRWLPSVQHTASACTSTPYGAPSFKVSLPSILSFHPPFLYYPQAQRKSRLWYFWWEYWALPPKSPIDSFYTSLQPSWLARTSLLW